MWWCAHLREKKLKNNIKFVTWHDENANFNCMPLKENTVFFCSYSFHIDSHKDMVRISPNIWAATVNLWLWILELNLCKTHCHSCDWLYGLVLFAIIAIIECAPIKYIKIQINFQWPWYQEVMWHRIQHEHSYQMRCIFLV